MYRFASIRRIGLRNWLMEIVDASVNGVCRTAIVLLTVMERIAQVLWLTTTAEGLPKCGMMKSKITVSDPAVSLQTLVS
jgi:hypothetical protein